MDKLKCITDLDGAIIPLNALSKISPIDSDVHYVWTDDGFSYNLSEEQYNALIKEVELIKET